MHLRDLMNKLDVIAEAPVAQPDAYNLDKPAKMPTSLMSDPQRAAYDKFKADDAKIAAIEQVKKYASIPLNQIPRLANAIDPKTGIIYYGDPSGKGSGDGNPKMMPLKFMSQGDQKPMVDALTAAGLKVVPHEVKQLFGTGQYAKVEPSALQQVILGPQAQQPTVRGEDPDADIKKLNALVAELDASLGGDIAPQITPPNTNVVKPPEAPKEKTLGQKAGLGAGIAAGGVAGAALGKKYGGKFGAVAGGLTGAALGGMGVNAMQEGVEYNSSIAQTLTESFGYEFEDRELDEYSMSQLGKDAGDFGRGAWNGVTLGAGDNIAAGVKSAFGTGTYKDELAKQTTSSKEAETRSPLLYGAGNIAGSIAVPIPGGAIAGGLIKGAGAAAKVARGGVALGTNLAAQQGVNMVKNASDTKTLGYDPSKYPTTPQEVTAFQKANGLTADGKVGPKTNAMLAKMGLTPPTVAEGIKLLRDKLAMIESGQWQLEEDADYRVWLTEDNTVIDDNGNQITDESVLNAIHWDQERLDELSLGGFGTMLGRGKDAIANVGRNLAGGFKGQDATGNLIKGTEKNFAQRMANPEANGKVQSAAEIARNSTNARGTANLANRAANYVGRNPGKVALGTGALVTGGIAAANALGGDDKPTDVPTNGPTTDVPTTDVPTTGPDISPMPSGGLTPEQQALIKQIKELMAKDYGGATGPEQQAWGSATSNAQAVVGKAEKANPAQIAQDKKNAAEAAAVTSAGEKKAEEKKAGDISASPAGTTKPPGIKPGDLFKDSQGVNRDASGKEYKQNPATKQFEPVTESDNELARWLRIARG